MSRLSWRNGTFRLAFSISPPSPTPTTLQAPLEQQHYSVPLAAVVLAALATYVFALVLMLLLRKFFKKRGVWDDWMARCGATMHCCPEKPASLLLPCQICKTPNCNCGPGICSCFQDCKDKACSRSWCPCENVNCGCCEISFS